MKPSGEGGQWEGNQSQLVYQPLTALLPELADLLPPEPLPSGSTSGNEQLRIWETVLMMLTAICERKPFLLVLDDLQYADTMSCELLGYLARRLSQYPLLIVGTYRDHEIASTHPFSPLMAQLQREQVLVRRQISALTDPQIEELISGAPKALARRIQQQAAGNPFFAEELARAFSKEGNDKNTPRTSRGIATLPETITAVLDQRVWQLSRPCQHFLSCAAVLGNAFTFPLLRLMTSSGSSSADEEGLLSLLEEALQARMLTEEGHGAWITYRFWHPLLLISHVYQKLSATRRTLLHHKAADALRQVYATREAEGAALILHHLLQSDAETRQVAHYAELAGHRAYALAAYPEAERYYRLALEQGEGITVTWPRGKWVSVTNGNEQRDHLTYLLECLGDCLRFQGKPREARDLYQQVLQIHAQPGTSARVVEQQEKAQFEAMLWCEIGYTWYDTGDSEQAL